MANDWLVNLPPWPQALLATVGSGLVSMALTLVFRTVIGTRRREGHNVVVGHVFATCGVVYAVLPAFVVLAAYTDYESAETITTREAASLIALYQDTERYPEPARSATQESIREYTRSVVNDEFPRMRQGRSSPVTRRWLNRLYVLNARLQPGDPYSVQLDNGAHELIDSIALLHDERIQASRTSLPWTFWLALVAGGVATLLLGAALFMEHPLHQLLCSFLLGMVAGTVLFLILSIDHPFAGSTAVEPSAFQRALLLYPRIDEMNRQPPGPAGPAGAAIRPA